MDIELEKGIILQVDPTQQPDAWLQSSATEILAAAEARGLVLTALAGTTALAETAEVVNAEPATETATVEVELTPEERERAADLQAAFAEKFSTDERKLTPEDFGVVVVGEGETRQVFVMLTTGNGLQHGSYNKIMDAKKANVAKYTVIINGQKVDTREGMTWELYQAFIAGAEDPLPDSPAFQAKNGGDWTATWLTGEQLDGFDAQYGDVRSGETIRNWGTRDSDWNDMRFRPAAAV